MSDKHGAIGATVCPGERQLPTRFITEPTAPPAAKEPRPDRWQPIATAPKDGRRMQLRWPELSGDEPVIGHWQVNGGWQALWLSESDHGTPTHWMPLPPAPSELKSKAGASAPLPASSRALDEAIERFVTGDGQSLENLSMSDDEWAGDDTGDIEVTIHRDDWVALIRHARKVHEARRLDEAALSLSGELRSEPWFHAVGVGEDANGTPVLYVYVKSAPPRELTEWQGHPVRIKRLSGRLRPASVAPLPASSPQATWRCFHCDELFTDKADAEQHFGYEFGMGQSVPVCLLTKAEIAELRALEQENARLRHDNEELENTARLWHEAEADRVRRIGNVQWWQELDSREGERLVLQAEVARLKAAQGEPAASSPAPQGAVSRTHGLERTSPMGGPFLGRCVYCGTDDLPMRAALEPCAQAPSQDVQVMDAISGPPVDMSGSHSAVIEELLSQWRDRAASLPEYNRATRYALLVSCADELEAALRRPVAPLPQQDEP